MATSERKIRVVIDSSGATAGARRVNSALQSITRTASGTSRSLANSHLQFIRTGSAARQMSRDIQAANNNVRQIGASAGAARGSVVGLSAAFSNLGAIIPLAALAGAVVAFTRLADAASQARAKIALATAQSGSFSVGLRDVRAIAASTRSDISAISELYGKMAVASRDLGATQRQVATVTENVARALRISGADAGTAAGAVRQFGQAMASGTLRGDELNTMMEAAPRLMQGLVSVLRRTNPELHATIGSIRNLAAEGKLTSQILFRAMNDREFTQQLREEMAMMPVTFSDATTAVKNNITEIAGALDRGIGASRAFYDLATNGQENMETILHDAESLGFEIRATFEALDNVFDPLGDNAFNVIQGIRNLWESLETDMKAGMRAWDDISHNYGTFGVSTTAAIRHRMNADPNFRPPAGFQDSATQFEQQRQASIARSEHRRFNREVDEAIDEAIAWGERPRPTPPPPASSSSSRSRQQRTPRQAYEAFERELAREGIHRNRGRTGYRTYADQADIYRRYGPGNAARPGTSDHEFWRALDLPMNTNDAAVARAAQRAGVRLRRPLRHNNHLHQGFEDANGDLAPSESWEEIQERIQQAEQRFWQQLQENVALAGMLPRQAEQYNAELELRRILGDGELERARELTDTERQRIATQIEQAATARVITDLRQTAAEAENAALVNGQRNLNLSDDQLTVEDEIMRRREDALNAGVSMAAILGEQYQTEEARLRTILQQNDAYDRQRQKLAEMRAMGRELFEQYRYGDPQSRPGQLAAAEALRAQQIAAAREQRRVEPSTYNQEWLDNVLEGIDRDFNRTFEEINNRFYDEMVDNIDRIGSQFGGVIGRVINGLASIVDALRASVSPDSGIGRTLNGLFGKNSSFMRTLNKMGAGAQIGTEIAGFAKMLGFKKYSTTGSQIGGALGSFLPIPGGEIIGSVIGGTIGSLFKKTPSASGSITMGPDGQLEIATAGSKKFKGEAGDAASRVVSGLYDIAERLGADLTGAPTVSIGLRDGKYRVDPTGRGITKTKKGAIDFGKDGAEAAIKFAIQDAIKDGVLSGLSSFSDRLLRNAKNLESAISLAESYEKLLKELAAIEDPVGASVKEVTSNLDKMLDMMRKAGATTEELANVERYRKTKLDELLKDQLSTLTDFKKALSGEGSGVTALNRLNANLRDFDKMRADIASGKVVDQDRYVDLGSEIFKLAGDIYGPSTSAFQDIRSMLMAATDGAIANVTDSFNDATVAAINNQTNQITQNQTVQTGYLAAIAASIEEMKNSSSGFGGANKPAAAVNGMLTVRSF